MRIDWVGCGNFDEYYEFRYAARKDDADFKEKMRRELEWWFNPPAGKGGNPAIAVRDDENKLMGQIVGLPVNLWVEGREIRTCWSIDTWTSPDARGKGVASTLIENLGKAYPFMIAPGSNAASQRRYCPPAFGHISQFYRYVGLINKTAFIKYFEAKMPALKIARPFSFLLPVPKKFKMPVGLEIKEIDSFGPEFDDLWDSLKGNFSVMGERTAQWLQWRFDRSPFRKYHRIAAYENSRLVGYLVMRWVEQQGAMKGFVTDIFTDFNSNYLTRALLRAAYEKGREAGLDYITVIASGESLEAKLKESRFIKIPYTSYDTIKHNSDEPGLDKTLTTRENWFITQADSDYDLNIRGLPAEELFINS